MKIFSAILVTALLVPAAFTNAASHPADPSIGPHPKLSMPEPDKSVSHHPNVVGWPEGKMPVAPAGFKVEKYAEKLSNPRWMYRLPNGDVLVTEATGLPGSANRISLFRGLNADGGAKSHFTFLKGLNQPFGMLLLNGYFYVANTDSIMRYPYTEGQTEIKGKGEKILEFEASGYHGHWTRGLLASPDGKKIYVSVGSASNVGEKGMEAEKRRANILEINPDGTGERVFASGLRNPIGIAFYSGTRTLWAAVNERDGLGDELVPDYLTHVQEGGFYGWPYSYFGQHEDPRLKGEHPELVKRAIVPDFSLGNHTASLSVDFYEGKMFPAKYQGGAFIGQHGSWNSSVMRGYDVYFVPFKNGKPEGRGEPFLTGFIHPGREFTVYGRPVGVLTLPDGSILVTDDGGDCIWRVSKG